jgi:hypothetical protein
MSVDVVEQVRRLVESFDELVDDVSTDEVLQRVGGPEPVEPARPPRRAFTIDDRSGWRRFSVAAAVVLVGGLVGALAWANADPSVPSSDTPPPANQTPPSQVTVPNDFGPADVVGTWVVTRRADGADDPGAQTFVPMASPLPTYRFDDDGTVSAFDGCNSLKAPWSFTDGMFTKPEVTSITVATSAMLCAYSDGNVNPTVGPSPERLESIDGTITMVFDDEVGTTAHAQRLSDLPTPQSLAGSSWILAINGPDIGVHFARDGTVEFRDGTTTCAVGSYTYDAAVLVLDLDASPDQCPQARLDELTGNPLEVASFSDDYMADTILLVPATGGAVRLFPASASTESTAQSSDTATASTANTIAGG